MLLDIKRDNRVTKIALNYWTDLFDDSSPWNFASASIGRKTPHLGSITLRYNYANRFGNNGQQLELDAYPAIYKGIYVYLSAGVSNKKNFPFSRISIEPYFKLPKSFEASLGIRYMNLHRNHWCLFWQLLALWAPIFYKGNRCMVYLCKPNLEKIF